MDSEIQRRATETLMNTSRVPFSKTQEQNQETLRGIVTQIENLEDKIPDLNKQVSQFFSFAITWFTNWGFTKTK